MWFSKNYEKISRSVSTDELRVALYEFEPDDIDLRDRDYQSIPVDDFLALAWKYGNGHPVWIAEKMDCDNITVCFMADVYRGWNKVYRKSRALAFGYIDAIIPGNASPHAFIWHYHNGKITFIEPQTYEVIYKRPRKVRLVEG